MTLKVALINMPFASLDRPSIALAQLRGAVQAQLGDRVSVDVHHVGHEFGRMMGSKIYQFVAHSPVSASGEWLFRKVAFPHLPDNLREYRARYSHRTSAQGWKFFEESIVPLRDRFADILDEIIQRRRLHEADVVGLTSMFWQNLPCIAMARRLKLANPKQIVVMGGANCEGTMGVELITNVDTIDYVFSGPALLSFPQFLSAVERGDRAACDSIDGVLSRRNSASISSLGNVGEDFDWSHHKPDRQVTGIKPIGRELDINADVDTDFDDYLVSLREYVPEILPDATIPFETSRGCWWGARAHCTFCGLNGTTMAYRAMQTERATALIQRLIDQYADRVSRFESVDNILAREYLTDVMPRLKVPPHVTLFYEVKADLSEEALKVLAAAGVREVQPGVEALATSTLKLMRKGTTAFNNLTLLANCAKHGVKPVWNLLIGFPGENEETYAAYKMLLPKLFHLPPPSGVYIVRFDRFSPYFTSEKEYDLKLVPYDFYGLCYPFPREVLRNMAYYFQDTNPDAKYIRTAARWQPELATLVAEWNRRWNSRDGRPQLVLSRTQEGERIDDTRGAERTHYLLPERESRLIRQIVQAQREEQLDEEQLELLKVLNGRGLTFSERGRVMSLVAEAACTA